MAIPSRYESVLASELWRAAFGRQSTIDRVLKYIVAHWTELQERGHAIDDMRWKQPEPKISRFFATSLRKHMRQHGIDGFFVAEHPNPEIDDVTQQLRSSGRTDITYLSQTRGHDLEIDIECKKLKYSTGAKESRALYCNQGVMRFVDGLYAKNTDIGFMIAFVESPDCLKDALDGVKTGMQEKPMVQRLRTLAKNGKTLVAPGTTFPICDFETRHARDHVENRADVLVGHIVLAHKY